MLHECELEVRGYELDSFGHVNNSVYLNYLEEARWQFLREVEWYDYFKKEKLFPVIIETNIRYIHEVSIFDKIIIKTKWTYKNNYLINEQEIYKKDTNIKVTKSKTKIILVSDERIIFDIPDFIKEQIDQDG